MNRGKNMKNNDYFLNRKNKYSIRKFTVGTASILIGSMLLAGQTVQAENDFGNNESSNYLVGDELGISDDLINPAVMAASQNTSVEYLGETGPGYNFSDLQFVPEGIFTAGNNIINFNILAKHNIAASTDNWVINLQIDERLVKHIESIQVDSKKTALTGGNTIQFERKTDSLGRTTNIWQVKYVRASGGLFAGGETMDTQTAPNGKIILDKPTAEI